MSFKKGHISEKDTEQHSERKSMGAIITCAVAVVAFIVIITVLLLTKGRNGSFVNTATDDGSIHVGNEKSYVQGDGEDEPVQTQEAVPADTPTPAPTQTAAPSDVPSSSPAHSSSPTPTQKPTQKPTDKPDPTSAPEPSPTEEPTPEPTDDNSHKNRSVGRFTLSEAAYRIYTEQSAKSKLKFSFESKEPHENRSPIKDFRHDGETFSEWKKKINAAEKKANEIFEEVKNSEEPTEYNVDISKYPWTNSDKIKSKYGDYYPYLPEKWFENMDYYIEESKLYDAARDNALREIAEEDAAFLESHGGSASVKKSGSDYIVICTIQKLNFEKAGEAALYSFYVDVC